MGGCGEKSLLRMTKLRSRAWGEGIQEKEEEGKKHTGVAGRKN